MRSLIPSPNHNPTPNLNRMNRLFDHEKLEVYQESLAFVAWLEPLLQKLPKSIQDRFYARRSHQSQFGLPVARRRLGV